jgi:hypothetical protein
MIMIHFQLLRTQGHELSNSDTPVVVYLVSISAGLTKSSIRTIKNCSSGSITKLLSTCETHRTRPFKQFNLVYVVAIDHRFHMLQLGSCSIYFNIILYWNPLRKSVYPFQLSLESVSRKLRFNSSVLALLVSYSRPRRSFWGNSGRTKSKHISICEIK